MSENGRSWWIPIAHFFAHIVVGTLIFIGFATAAALVWLFVHWLEALGVDPFIISVLTIAERGILLVDIGLFMVHLAATAVKAVKEMVR